MKHDRVCVRIRGRVQGVFFRAGTREMALQYGLTGFVRNVPDGSVEAVFEGPKADLKNALEWCRTGPPGALVSHVDERWERSTGQFSGFEVTS